MDLERLDRRAVRWLEVHGHRWLRYSLAIIFIWFGFLKVIGLSPAAELVARTITWMPPQHAVLVVGIWETVIGACLLWRPLLRVALILMAGQMAGTFLPLVTLPGVTWAGFLTPTLEGQYIIKNIVLISAGMVVGGTARHRAGRLLE